MSIAHIYGFAHEDIDAARSAIESTLSVRFEEAQEEAPPAGLYYRMEMPSGTCVKSAVIQARSLDGRAIPRTLGIQIMGY